MSLAIIKAEKRIRVIEIRARELRVGVFRQDVEGEPVPAKRVDSFQSIENIFFPLLCRCVQLDVEDSAGDGVVGLGQSAFLRDERDLFRRCVQIIRHGDHSS